MYVYYFDCYARYYLFFIKIPKVTGGLKPPATPRTAALTAVSEREKPLPTPTSNAGPVVTSFGKTSPAKSVDNKKVVPKVSPPKPQAPKKRSTAKATAAVSPRTHMVCLHCNQI